MIPRFVRTAEDLKAARHALGLSADGLALMVRVEDGRTVRRWEAGERPIPGPVTVIMEIAMDYLNRKIDLAQQLDRLNSGKMMVTGHFGLGPPKPTPADERIAAVEAELKEVEDALVIMTRRPPSNGSLASRAVHWYTLLRMTPKHNPPEEDRWTLPGETSPEAALLYFEKDSGFGALELCEAGDHRAEFLLEQRVADRQDFGASQRIRPGDLVQNFYVRRASSANI